MLNKQVNYNAKTGDLIMMNDVVYYVHDSHPQSIQCEAISSDLPMVRFYYCDLTLNHAIFCNDIWNQDLQKSHLRRSAEEIKENSKTKNSEVPLRMLMIEAIYNIKRSEGNFSPKLMRWKDKKFQGERFMDVDAENLSDKDLLDFYTLVMIQAYKQF